MLGRRLFGIPSYHVQQMLATHLGLEYIDTVVTDSSSSGAGGVPAADTLAAGASCLNTACDEVRQASLPPLRLYFSPADSTS